MTPAQQIIKSLEEEPQNWACTKIAVYHIHGYRIYYSFGILGIELISGPDGPRVFNLSEKFKINKAIKKWLKHPLRYLNPPPSPITIVPPMLHKKK
jgi:hypothetical protein